MELLQSPTPQLTPQVPIVLLQSLLLPSIGQEAKDIERELQKIGERGAYLVHSQTTSRREKSCKGASDLG